jgi:methylglutaconyl-CoA hydratase
VCGSDLRELLLNPDFVSAERALAIGLANRVVPRAGIAAAGEELAGEILGKASSESIARTKRLLLELPGLRLDERLGAAATANAAARATADCRRGIATFLAEKRTPDWRGIS